MSEHAPHSLSLSFLLESEDETERLGRVLAACVEPNAVIALVGELGAGKTRLARAIAEALGAGEGEVSSPTFVLVQEYAGRLRIYHLDAYRLKDEHEFEALGVAEMFESRGVSLVEWADRVWAGLPERRWLVELSHVEGLPRWRRARVTAPADVLRRLVEG